LWTWAKFFLSLCHGSHLSLLITCSEQILIEQLSTLSIWVSHWSSTSDLWIGPLGSLSPWV
jgi:hypothetical protein